HVVGRAVEIARRLHAVAVAREQLLHLANRRIAFAEYVNWAIRGDRRRLDPEPDPGIVQDLPGKFLARVLLARRRDVGMAKHAAGRNAMTGEDAAAERRPRRNLAARKLRIAMIVSRVGDLDADRARVDVGLTRPR